MADDDKPSDRANVVENASEPRQYYGVWLYSFENSTFLEGASKVPEERPSDKQASWLDYHPSKEYPGQFVENSHYDLYDPENKCYPVYPFLVSFVGKNTTAVHGSGRLGLWDSKFTVEDIISSEPLGPPFCYGR